MSHARSLPIRLALAIALLGIVVPAARAQVAVFDIQAFVPADDAGAHAAATAKHSAVRTSHRRSPNFSP